MMEREMRENIAAEKFTGDGDGGPDGRREKDAAVPVNLRRMYPLAFRSILRRSVRWIAFYPVLLVILVFVQALLDEGTGETAIDDTFVFVSGAIARMGSLLLLGKLFYEFLYYRVFYYGLEMDHFVVSRGVLAKTRGSFPLAKLTDVYVSQSLVDLVFGLHNLSVTTPSPLTNQGVVSGLSAHAARALQQHILALSIGSPERPGSKRAEEMVSEGITTVDPTLLGPSPARRDPEVFQDPKRASNA